MGNHKTIIITESQKRRLFEAATDSFSIQKLEWLDGEEQYDAAVSMLGKPFNSGSSRFVFAIDDYKVLKLAVGGAGIMQNEAEYNVFINSGKNPLVPVIYDVSNDFSLMVCEHVIEAEEVDFERYAGIPFENEYVQNTSPYEDGEEYYYSNTPIGYDKYFGNELKKVGQKKEKFDFCDIALYLESRYVTHEFNFDEDGYQSFIDNNEFLSMVRDLVRTTKVSDIDGIDNWGIANRNGREMLVLLDSGMNFDVHKEYYG